MSPSPDEAGVQARLTFLVEFQRSASTLVRVIGLFAQRDLNITAMSLIEAGDGQALSIDVPTIDSHIAEILSAKIANVIGVQSVRTSSDREVCFPH